MCGETRQLRREIVQSSIAEVTRFLYKKIEYHFSLTLQAADFQTIGLKLLNFYTILYDLTIS